MIQECNGVIMTQFKTANVDASLIPKFKKAKMILAKQ